MIRPQDMKRCEALMIKTMPTRDLNTYTRAQLQALLDEIGRELDRREFEAGLRQELAKFKRANQKTLS